MATTIWKLDGKSVAPRKLNRDGFSGHKNSVLQLSCAWLHLRHERNKRR